MLPFQKEGCVEATYPHKMKLEEKRVFSGFCRTNGEQSIPAKGFYKSVLAENLNYYLHNFFSNKRKEKKLVKNSHDFGSVPVQSVNKDKFPTLNPITQKFSLQNCLGMKLAKKITGEFPTPCFASNH